MRTVICFFFTLLPFCLSSQTLLDTRLDIRLDNISIEDALLHLSEKANCSISFNSNYFSADQKISLHVRNATLKNILQKCLYNSGYTFKIVDNTISLIALPPPIYTISGFVEDSLSGERLIAATVVDIISGRGTTTNEYGFYSLPIPKGNAQLNYSYLGFQSKDYNVSIGKDLHFSIGLNASITLGEVIVTDTKILPQSSVDASTTPNFKSKAINKIPAIAGEVDVLRYFQTLAGVQSGSQGVAGLHVRGGNADQNLVLLDGVPVYNPTHSLGLFSIFNTHTIKSAQLYKGALPAQYGGRLSSVIDIRTREGDTKAFHGGLNIGLLATSAYLEGPIVKDKTSFLISARRTHVDPIIREILGNDSGGYYFYDTNVKLNHKFSDKDRLYFSFYKGGDDFQMESEYVYKDETFLDSEINPTDFIQNDFLSYKWGNTIFSLRWNHLWNNQFFSNMTFTYSQFNFTNDYGIEEFFTLDETKEGEEELPNLEEDFLLSEVSLFHFSSKINDGGFKIDFNYLPTSQHHFKFGGGVLVREFSPSLVSDQFEVEEYDFNGNEFEIFETFIDPIFYATEINMYGEDEFKINNQLKAKLGLHSVLFIAPNKVYPSIQPRLSINYQPNDKIRLKSSLGKMTQFLHVLQSTITGIPNDLWVPSTKQVRPQSAWQADVGIHYRLSKHFNWNLEGYYKYMNHLITYREDTNFLVEEEAQQFDWENNVSVGKGWSYGLETSLTKTTGKTTGWINYNLAWSDRQYEGINNNQKFPFRYNRRHELKIGLSQQFTRVFNLFATWKYGSGQWTTVQNLTPETEDTFNPIVQPFPLDPNTPINNFQLQAFHRLDVNANFTWSKRRIKHQLTLGVSNAYGRDNTLFAAIENGDASTLEEIGFPLVLPTFRYGVEF